MNRALTAVAPGRSPAELLPGTVVFHRPSQRWGRVLPLSRRGEDGIDMHLAEGWVMVEWRRKVSARGFRDHVRAMTAIPIDELDVFRPASLGLTETNIQEHCRHVR